jgi:hypothetical protein
MRVKSFVSLQVSEDKEGKQCLFGREDEGLNTVTDDNRTEIQSGVLILAGGAIDLQVNFGGVSQAAYVYLEADGDFSYKLNSTLVQAQTMKKHTVAVGLSTARTFLTTDATALYLTNPDPVDPVRLTYCIVGV